MSAMSKEITCFALQHALPLQEIEVGIKRYPAQHQHDPNLIQQNNLFFHV